MTSTKKSTVKKSTKSASSGRSPKTMEELLKQASTQVKSFSVGDNVEAVVVSKTSKRLVLDIGGKGEGLVAERAFNEARDFIKQIEVGDKVKGRVLITETPDGYTIISLRHAAKNHMWGKLKGLEKGDKDIMVEVKGVNPAGVVVDMHGLTGFIPTSHLGKKILKNTSSLPGSKLKVKVIEIDEKQNRIVLSEKAVSEADELRAQEDATKMIKEGKIYDGIVTTVTDFGVFVAIKISGKGKGSDVELEGLVHISEMSWGKIGKPSDVLRVGEKVKVKALGAREGKISFSMKQAEEDPWDKVEKKYKQESKITGKVTKLSDFGVFVELEPGIEGLVHLTKIPPGKKLRLGDDVKVNIEEVDPKEKKISLGLVLTEKPVGYK
ncbi:30S ribosomal protein S1 [Patescibacteria group bacterium]